MGLSLYTHVWDWLSIPTRLALNITLILTDPSSNWFSIPTRGPDGMQPKLILAATCRLARLHRRSHILHVEVPSNPNPLQA